MKLYNLKKIAITFGAVVLNQHFAEDGALAIAKNSADFMLVMSADGKGTRYVTNDDSAKMTLKLMQTSPLNAILSAIRAADKLAPNGAGISPWTCKDNLGTSLYLAAEAFLSTPPNPEFNKSPTSREWLFETDLLVDFTGGA